MRIPHARNSRVGVASDDELIELPGRVLIGVLIGVVAALAACAPPCVPPVAAILCIMICSDACKRHQDRPRTGHDGRPVMRTAGTGRGRGASSMRGGASACDGCGVW